MTPTSDDTPSLPFAEDAKPVEKGDVGEERMDRLKLKIAFREMGRPVIAERCSKTPSTSSFCLVAVHLIP
jgi:hypothetical protein